MARKVVVLNRDRSTPVLEEIEAPEEELQEALKLNPELLPAEDLGVEGPLMIVGRETSLASGAVDLLALGRGGEIVVIEFKTGPQNSDFRSATAQLLDYGAQLWRMSYEEFERSVALRYLLSGRCPAGCAARGATTLAAAAKATWPDIGDEGLDVFERGLSIQLKDGSFRYVLVAQRFTPTMVKTLGYLNAQLEAATFCGVEMIRFGGEALAILEARVIVRPDGSSTGGSRPRQSLDEQRFLERIEDSRYREALQRFFEGCRGLGMSVAWGAAGASVRLTLPTTGRLVSVAWVFPPGVSGWMGLTDLTAGFDTSKPEDPGVRAAFETYLTAVGQLPGAAPGGRVGLEGVHLDPASAVVAFPGVIDAIAALRERLEAA